MATTPHPRTPKIIDGARGPQHAPRAGHVGVESGLPAPKPGQRIFKARSTGFILNLGKMPDKYDNRTQSTVPGFEFTAHFQGGFIVFPAYFDQHSVPEDCREEFLRRLDESKYKGIDFWDVEELTQQARVAQTESIRQQLRDNPDLKRALAAELNAEEGFLTPDVEDEEEPAEDPVEPAVVRQSKPKARKRGRPRMKKD